MTQIGRKKQKVGSGAIISFADGGSPQQFHVIGELTGFGLPGFPERLKELTSKANCGGQLTSEDFWALTGIPVAERLKRMATRARNVSAFLRVAKREGSEEHHTEINRRVVQDLQHLQSLAAPPPSELIDLIAEQLRVSGRPRGAHKDDVKWQKAVTLIAENPEISSRLAARSVGVDHKAMLVWRKDQEFLKAVRSYCENTKHLNTWKAMQARKTRRNSRSAGRVNTTKSQSPK